jgi:hypothetical protein
MNSFLEFLPEILFQQQASQCHATAVKAADSD